MKNDINIRAIAKLLFMRHAIAGNEHTAEMARMMWEQSDDKDFWDKQVLTVVEAYEVISERRTVR